MSATTFELDLTDIDSVEKLEAGPAVAVGWYAATVAEYYQDEKKDGDHVFKIEVTKGVNDGGAYDGRMMYYRFTDPAHYDDEKKAGTARRRIGMLASRLSLVTQDSLGKVVSVDFDKAINRDCVIEVVRDEWETTDELTGSTVKKSINKINYAGIYPPDHPDIPADVRAALKLPPARPKTMKGAKGGTIPAAGNNGTTAGGVPATPGGGDPFAGL